MQYARVTRGRAAAIALASLSLEHISCVHRTRQGVVRAVDNLSLHAADRELVVLVGPSGCGKTTTLRLIAGLEEPSSGVIRIGDRAVNDVTPRDRDVAMVFQNYALYPHMTVFNNMAFGLKMRSVPKPQIDQAVNQVARRLEAEGSLSRLKGEDGKIKVTVDSLVPLIPSRKKSVVAQVKTCLRLDENFVEFHDAAGKHRHG